ncbi:hypothetical protein CR513_55805, partial [Mucuna pruriens]
MRKKQAQATTRAVNIFLTKSMWRRMNMSKLLSMFALHGGPHPETAPWPTRAITAFSPLEPNLKHQHIAGPDTPPVTM